jgi:hypothetical protein
MFLDHFLDGVLKESHDGFVEAIEADLTTELINVSYRGRARV